MKDGNAATNKIGSQIDLFKVFHCIYTHRRVFVVFAKAKIGATLRAETKHSLLL